MEHGDAREGKWRGNWRKEWVASTLHTTSEHGVSSITTAEAHTSAASSRLNWRPCWFKWTRPFRRKTICFLRVPSHFKRSLQHGYHVVGTIPSHVINDGEINVRFPAAVYRHSSPKRPHRLLSTSPLTRTSKGCRGPFPRMEKRPQRYVDHSSSSSAQFTNENSNNGCPLCLHPVDRKKCTITFTFTFTQYCKLNSYDATELH